MQGDHPEAETLARYTRGELGREASRELELHLAGCVACQKKVDELPANPGVVRWRGHRFGYRPAEPATGAESGSGTCSESEEQRRERMGDLLRALGEVIAATGETALARLLAAPEHRRRALIRNEPGFHTAGLCELLEARCRAAWSQDAAQAVELGKLAVLIAQRLDPELYGGQVEDVRALAWLHLGNSFRIASLQPVRDSEARWVAEGPREGKEGAYPAGAIAPHLLGEMAVPLPEIEAALRETRDAFLERGRAYDAALVTLDLVAAYRRAGRSYQAARLLREAVERLEASGAPAYALDALRFLLAGAEGSAPEPLADPIPERVLERVARLLQRKRGSPEARFEGERG